MPSSFPVVPNTTIKSPDRFISFFDPNKTDFENKIANINALQTFNINQQNIKNLANPNFVPVPIIRGGDPSERQDFTPVFEPFKPTPEIFPEEELNFPQPPIITVSDPTRFINDPLPIFTPDININTPDINVNVNVGTDNNTDTGTFPASTTNIDNRKFSTVSGVVPQKAGGMGIFAIAIIAFLLIR